MKTSSNGSERARALRQVVAVIRPEIDKLASDPDASVALAHEKLATGLLWLEDAVHHLRREARLSARGQR